MSGPPGPFGVGGEFFAGIAMTLIVEVIFVFMLVLVFGVIPKALGIHIGDMLTAAVGRSRRAPQPPVEDQLEAGVDDIPVPLSMQDVFDFPDVGEK